jgi:hypothetical protein
MKKEIEYSGYRIVCRSAGRWFAQIFPPDSAKPIKEVPVANQVEGCDHLIELAKIAVDHHKQLSEPSAEH